ncbi:hypothetical protein TorRG33x02_296360 [Trema orientale]|uniref:Uncharacterized protein n=1 Tax=Trema orientale TaxID=63057 RepID=A0A2P5C5T9_TREOI|nr:hypothetical protein TorRG33x02_296360 [Trema orientale]
MCNQTSPGLISLQLITSVKPSSVNELITSSEIQLPETMKFYQRNKISSIDHYLFFFQGVEVKFVGDSVAMKLNELV